jgi:hypothetical protein
MVKQNERLHLLDRTTCTIEGQRFVGFTNWYDPRPHVTREDRTWYDYVTIRGHAKTIFREHAADVEFSKCITQDDVVVTHMLPRADLVHAKYANHPANKYFVSERHNAHVPKAWIFGHSHFEKPLSRGNFHARTMGYDNEFPIRARPTPPLIIDV